MAPAVPPPAVPGPGAAPSGLIVVLTTAVPYATEDPGSLVESCQRALERILRTHRGRPIRRSWIDSSYREEEPTLLEEEVLPARPHSCSGARIVISP